MPLQKYLIVNADDFGQSAGINRGIIDTFEHGIVTSASLMVRWPCAAEAAEYARAHSDMSVGLHVDLGEWTYRQGEWVQLYEVVQKDDSAAVAEEVSRQLSTFVELLGRKPTHIDSHQHVHSSEPVRSILIETARQLAVPLRHHSAIHYCGDFYGQMADGAPLWDHISVDALGKLLRNLSNTITELGCHPAGLVDIETMYAAERLREREILCDRRIRDFLTSESIQLCSFHNVSGATG